MGKIPSRKILGKMPKRFVITNCKDRIIATCDMPVTMHFYTNNYDWYMIEYDKAKRIFFGYKFDKKEINNSSFENTRFEDITNYHANNDSEVTWDENWTLKKLYDIKGVPESLGTEYWSDILLESNNNEFKEPFYKKLYHLCIRKI